jgi:hypothetical protein
VNSSSFFPLYLEASGGANVISRTGHQYADQFFQDVLPDTGIGRAGIPKISEYMHPTIRTIITKSRTGNCTCVELIVSDITEKCALLNLSFPRVSLARSLKEKFDGQVQFTKCSKCGNIREDLTQMILIEAPQIIAVSVQRIEHKTRKIIDDLVIINEESSEHDIFLTKKDSHVVYRLAAAIQPTKNHFVALLKSTDGEFIKVDDDKKPSLAEPEEIGKAEIYIFRKSKIEIPTFNV